MKYFNLTITALAALLSLVHTLSSDLETGTQPDLSLSVLTSHQSPPHPISLRSPSAPDSASWINTPRGWFLGTWYFIYSNQASYTTFRNMQWTLSLLSPNTDSDSWNDVVTYNLGNTSTVVQYIYGVDSPMTTNGTVQRDEYAYAPTGPISFAGNVYKILAWGYDASGVPFAVLYETKSAGQTEDSFDVISRSNKGPSQVTLEMIWGAVNASGNASLVQLKNEARGMKIVQDGGRDGQEYPLCNATCETNAYTGLF